MPSFRIASLPVVLATFLIAITAAGPQSKPQPVRTALEARYAAMRVGYFARDSSVVLGMRLPGFFSITPAGDTVPPEAVRAYTRASFAQVETTLALDWKLGSIEVRGDTAAVELDQHWVRRQLKGGAIRHVDTYAHQRETWLRSGEEWLLWRIDHIQPGVWRVDGKRIDPAKPYDPGAPEYRP
jgi:hypothetical protein